jgi:DNA-binding SARP family transcriptional activator
VHVPRGKQRAVLALLATHVGRVVPAERLVDELWGGHPPPAATAVLHSDVSKLRRALGGTDGPLVTRAPGYVLDVPERDVDGPGDAGRAEALAATAAATGEALGVDRRSPTR